MESQHNQLTLSFVNINSTFKSKCNKSTNFFKSINSIILPILFLSSMSAGFVKLAYLDLFQFLLDGPAIVLVEEKHVSHFVILSLLQLFACLDQSGR